MEEDRNIPRECYEKRLLSYDAAVEDHDEDQIR